MVTPPSGKIHFPGVLYGSINISEISEAIANQSSFSAIPEKHDDFILEKRKLSNQNFALNWDYSK